MLILLMAMILGGPAFLSATEINYKQLYKDVSPSVVLVYGHDGKSASRGTGSIIEKNGLILTNTHVVTNGKDPWKHLIVFLKPDKLTGNVSKDMNRAFTAKIMAINPKYDLALLQMLNPPGDLVPLPLLENLDSIDRGEATAAIGHPGGGAAWTLTTGLISAVRQSYNDVEGWNVIQTQTPINPGNSGGPLLDGAGTIIGINTFIVRKGADGLALEGLNYAVTAVTARKWIEEVMGQLPEVPRKQVETDKPPKPEIVQKAAPPQQKEAETVKPFIAKKSTPEKRKTELPKAPKKTTNYTSKTKPGMEFLGKEFDEEEFMKPFENAKFE